MGVALWFTHKAARSSESCVDSAVSNQLCVLAFVEVSDRGRSLPDLLTLGFSSRSSEQTVDFAKRSGILSFSLHPQRPLLVTHWHSFHSNSSIVAWEFRPSIGGGSGAGNAGVTSEWLDLISASYRAAHGGGRLEEDTCAAGVCWHHQDLVSYKSAHTRSLSLFTAGDPDTTSSSPSPLESPSLSSTMQLNLEQYWNYQEIPPNLVQITVNPEATSGSSIGSSEYILQHFALQTGSSDKLDDLPVWKNYQGKSLVPWKLVANHNQSVVCVQLQDPVRAQRSPFPSGGYASGVADLSFSYVVMEIKQRAGGSSSRRADPENGEDGGASSSSSNFRVVCGSQLDALDFCFADCRSDDAKQNRPWLLVVLASTGKSLCLQTQCDQVESTRILLQREVLRMFASPIALSPQSPHATTIGSRLLYLSMGSDSRQLVQLSEDDLNVPHPASAACTWKTNSNEQVLNATWNTSSVAPSQVSGEETLLAVQTTKRLVILNKTLRQVREYDLDRDLQQPQTLLWMAQSLLFVTKDNQLRYLVPLRTSLDSNVGKSRLVCCLGERDPSVVQHVKLLSVCGDRLSYAVADPRTLETKTFLRPISICEPLLIGFISPNEKLKAILERDVLVFAMTGGVESPCPITDYLLHVLYHEFGWRDTTLRLVDALMNRSGGSVAATGTSASGGGATSTYPKTSHLSAPLLASLFLHSHKWKEFLKVFLATDPGLEEYALADEDSGATSVKLPSRTGQTAQRFRRLGQILDSIGQSELAVKCFDLAGDDLSIVEMARKAGASASPLLTALQKDWTKMNPPLSSIVKAGDDDIGAAYLDSVVWRRHDLFSLLCCDVLLQNERRSRLLTSVKPFDKMSLSAAKNDDGATSSGAAAPSLDKATTSARANILYWKRLVPEDAKDWIGVSSTPHFSAEDPKNPNYGFASANASLLAGAGGAAGVGSGSSLPGGESAGSDFGAASGGSTVHADAANAKMTIGPFVDEEDAVVAYWRFEEGGANLTASEESEKNGGSGAAVESLDTSKRENNLQVLGFGTATKLVASSAPVDKGEEGRIQEAFALQLPASESSSAASSSSGEWGAKCIVRSGSTLDIGFVFDEDPYRRKFTFEAWIRNFVLARKQQQQQEDGDLESSTASQFADPEKRSIVCRKSPGDDAESLWWGFSLVDGQLVLDFAGHSIKSDDKVSNAASWHHVAFSIDILSQKQATVKLFLHGRCVGVKDISSVDGNAKYVADGSPSYLHLGWQLRDYEMTEVRVWAAARTQDQLSDMKENYLGIAEAKKRMKIAIHQRNCQCEKCHSRRTKAPVAKLSLGTPFPTTPPSATVRDRRRPQSKQ